jgi:hypothetical protein
MQTSHCVIVSRGPEAESEFIVALYAIDKATETSAETAANPPTQTDPPRHPGESPRTAV